MLVPCGLELGVGDFEKKCSTNHRCFSLCLIGYLLLQLFHPTHTNLEFPLPYHCLPEIMIVYTYNVFGIHTHTQRQTHNA